MSHAAPAILSSAAVPAGPWVHRFAPVNGLRLHYVEAGDPAGPLVVLLHGFPGFWYCWRHQIPTLAAAGFRVVAPDMRGYGLSDKPPSVCDYAMPHLVADVVGLARHLGAERFDLVGHDWGGVIAFPVAAWHSDQVRRLAVLNAPHPAAYLREVRRVDPPKQLLRSWYAFFFQLPWLPEALLSWNDYAALKELLRHDPARPGAFTADDVTRYVAAWSRPQAMKSTINYYRANLRRSPVELARSTHHIPMPTLLIWGERDNALVPELTEGLEGWVPDLRVRRLPRASHWVQHDEPEKVSRWLVEFFGDGAPRRAGLVSP